MAYWDEDNEFVIYFRVDPNNNGSVTFATDASGYTGSGSPDLNTPWLSVDSRNNAAVTYYDFNSSNYALSVFNTAGSAIVPPTDISNGNAVIYGPFGYNTLSSSDSRFTYGYSVPDAKGLVHFVWLDGRDGDNEVFYAPLDYYTPDGLIKINGGALFTNSLNVNLDLSSTTDNDKVTTMTVSNDAALTGATPEAFATAKTWTLLAGADGLRNVYGKFSDRTGNESSIVAASITLDTVPPVVSGVTPPAGSDIKGNIVVGVTATDDRSGVERVEVWLGDKLIGSDSTGPYEIPWDTLRLTGSQTIRILVYDRAGNLTTVTRTYTARNLPYTDGTHLVYLFALGLLALAAGLVMRRKALA